MELNYNSIELSKAINDFYNATGINITIVDPNHNFLSRISVPKNFCSYIQNCPEGTLKCLECDKALIKKCEKSLKTEQHICHAGLLDTAVPIIRDDIIIGYIIFGQLRNNADFDTIYELIDYLEIDRETLKKEYEKLPYCDKTKTQSIVNIAKMLTEYILFKNLLKPKYDIVFENATFYIQNNLHREISTKKICDNIGVSKNVLYKVFKTNIECTVGEYITEKRIEKAKELFENTKLSVQEISEKVGIDNYTYFCKLFKKSTGITPFQYRKKMSH